MMNILNLLLKTIQVFGNLDNIKCARNGTQDGRSANSNILQKIAEYKWMEC